VTILASQRHLWDIPREIAYFNCAYMSPLSRAVVVAGTSGLAAKSRPWEIAPASFFTTSEVLRGLYGEILGVDSEGIALVPSASYGMAIATANLPLAAGSNVVVPAEEFPSSVHAWRKKARAAGAEVRTVPRPEDGDWTRALEAAIDARTAVVCTSHVHWVCGGMLDLARVSRATKAVGAALVLDITQSVSVVDPDIAACDPDFVVAAGYKWLMGPYSLGLLYVAPRHRSGTPLEEGWIVREASQDFARLVDYREEYQPGARRFDVGERSNFALVPAAIAACRELLDWGRADLAATLGAMTTEIADRTRPLGARALPETLRAPHYLGLEFENGLPEGLVARLAAEGVFVSVRGDRLRLTPHLYDDAADLDRLTGALARVLAR
jgi:selenocysteine lyase/cysteine desulfurase